MHAILIPGLWLVGSSWDRVVPVLEEAGHQVHPLTLPGMGSRRLDRSAITLRDHVEDVVELIDSLTGGTDDDAGPVVLVAHAAGGAIAHAAVDARPDRVARVVYVAGGPRGDGELGGEWPAGNGEVPLPDWSAFDEAALTDLDDGLREELRRGSVPSPESVVRDPQKLTDERRYDVPVTVVSCERPSAELEQSIADSEPGTEELARIKDVTHVDLPTGHWPQLTRPVDLGELLVLAIED